MKIKFNLFFYLLFSMLFFRIVDDDGAGGDEDEEIGDFDITDDDIEIKVDDKDKDDETKDKKDEEPPDDALKELQDFKTQIENEREVIKEAGKLSEKYSDFDISKIHEKLKGMSEAEQEEFNSPLGWELLHLQNFQKKETVFDPFDSGRGGTKEPFDFDKAYEKLEKGDRSIVADLIANSR